MTAPTTMGVWENAFALPTTHKKKNLVIQFVIDGVALHRDQARALESHEHRPVRLLPRGAHRDDAVVRPRAGLALADDLGLGVDGVAGEHWRGQAHLVPAEVGDGLLAHVGDAHPGNNGERQARVDQRSLELGTGAVGGVDVQGMLVHRQQGEPGVVGLGEGAPGAVLVDVADLEFLVVAPGRFAVAPRPYFLCPTDHKRIPTMKDALGAIVGKSNVLTAPEDTKPYYTDWRRQFAAKGECVVRPGSADEVARVVALCAREGVAVVPQGGNTGLVGGS